MRPAILMFLIILAGCDTPVSKTPQIPLADTVSADTATENVADDSIPNFDTTTIAGKAAKLLQQYRDSGDHAATYGVDTLMDMNGDTYQDILLESYGEMGTGLKNRADIYLFDRHAQRFINENPIFLSNPTFDFRKKLIYAYYVGSGGGYAYKLKWHDMQLDTLEFIEMDLNLNKPSNGFKSVRHNYVTGKVTHHTADMVELPKEYNYFEYKHVIKRLPE